MIADIAKLESSRRAGFTLDGKVPFLIHLRLHLGRPNIHDGSRERIAWDSSTRARLCLVSRAIVDRGHLRRRERGVASKAKVGTGTFQVGGNGVSATQDRLALQPRR